MEITLTRTMGCLLATLVAVGTARAQPGTPVEGPPPPPELVPPPPPLPAATPGVCVTIDPQRDTLTEQERLAARGLVLQAFANERLAIDATNTACTEVYTISNIKLGSTINVTISGQRGMRTGRSTSLDDLSNVYSQMVKSLVTGVTMETGGGAVDRTNVTKEQAAPRRVAVDSLKYVSLGYGAVAGVEAYGPAFGFGYRKELDRIGLDISVFNFILGNDSEFSDGMTISFLKLVGVVYQQPTADSTMYYGGGVSYGAVVFSADDSLFTGSGLQGHLIAGYEAFRSSTIRGFIQADLTLPFYKATADLGSSSTDDARRYPPTFTIGLGFGWGKSNVVRVVNE